MSNVYAVSEVVGSSTEGIEDAIENAVSTAAGQLRHLAWFEVTQIRGHLNTDGSVAHYQVGVKIGFRYEA